MNISNMHSPASHGNEFWTSGCKESACVRYSHASDLVSRIKPCAMCLSADGEVECLIIDGTCVVIYTGDPQMCYNQNCTYSPYYR